jgi:P27 family predicted phage terminase small subunit
MRGRKPKPTRLRETEGNTGRRRLNRSEPEFVSADPVEVPEWLSEGAKAEWRRVAPHLARLGLLSVVDMAALAGYCLCYARLVEAEAFIAEHGMTATLRDDKGNIKAVSPVPQVGIALKMLDKIRQFAAEFGFTPSARGRLEISKAREVDPASDLAAVRAQVARPRDRRKSWKPSTRRRCSAF